MPKLRHIAVTVPDLEEAARFYETTFGLTGIGIRHRYLAF